MLVIRAFTSALGRLHRQERGQVIFLYIMVITVFLAVAVLGIDATLWHSQRRTAQKDADAVAFAAGEELFKRSTTADIQSRVSTAANAYTAPNGIDSTYFTNGSPVTVNQCFASASFDGLPDGVQIDVSKQGSSLFSALWNAVAPDVGAHAKVCIGSPPDADGLLPFGIQVDPSVNPDCFNSDGSPKFGAICPITVRASSGASGETGVLSLYDDNTAKCSAADVTPAGKSFAKDILIPEIRDGAHTTCAIAASGSNVNNCQIVNADGIGSCVDTQTGNLAKDIVDGLQQRLAKEGKTTAPNNCDDLFPDSYFGASRVRDHVDQWWEALFPATGDIHSITPSSNVFFEKRSCTAPRLVTLILVDKFPGGGQCWCLIKGFAGFYIT